MPRVSIVVTIGFFILFVAAGISGGISNATKHAGEASVEAYFGAPSHGATLTGPVQVIFGLRGMGVAPAGVEKPGTGHHHLLIDVDPLAGDKLLEAIPSDENHRHFGGGQTETMIELASGRHTLQIVLGDHNHIPHAPPVMSEQITITVK